MDTMDGTAGLIDIESARSTTARFVEIVSAPTIGPESASTHGTVSASSVISGFVEIVSASTFGAVSASSDTSGVVEREHIEPGGEELVSANIPRGQRRGEVPETQAEGKWLDPKWLGGGGVLKRGRNGKK